jgi:hypothetical protein
LIIQGEKPMTEQNSFKIFITEPVYDLEYGVIGCWRTYEVEAFLTRRKNWRVSLRYNNFVFSSKTGKLLNRNPKNWLIKCLERNRYLNILPHVIMKND